MTGREFILYILENGLENEDVFKNGKPIGFLTVPEVAAKLNVGVSTVNAWISLEKISYVTIGNVVYIPANFKSPYA